jgi:hypothetical protein
MARKKKDVALTSTGLPADYAAFLESLKSRIQQAQMKAGTEQKISAILDHLESATREGLDPPVSF